MTDIPPTPPADAPREPLITVATLVALTSAVIAALVAFGVHMDADQRNTILTLIGLIAPLVVGVWGRAKVYAPATVRDMVIANRADARKRP